MSSMDLDKELTASPEKCFDYEFKNIALEPSESIDQDNIKRMFFSFSLADIKRATEMNSKRLDAIILEKMRIFFPKYKITKLPTKFRTLRQYQYSFLPLILVEAWANLVKDYTDKLQSPGQKEKWSKNRFNLCLDSIENADYEEDLVTFNLESYHKADASDDPDSRCYQFALLECGQRSWLVFIDDVISNNIFTYDVFRVQMKTRSFIQLEVSAFIDHISVDVILKPFFYLKPSIRHMKTIEDLNSMPQKLINEIMEPNLQTCALNTTNTKFEISQERLNAKQTEAIVACLNALDDPTPKIQLIQGPPGTGKTSTLVGLVKNIFAIFNTQQHGPICLLICAPSNGAIDNVGLKLLEESYKLFSILHRSVKIVRIGSFQKVHKDVQQVHISELIGVYKDEEEKKMIIDEILASADIILTTLGSSQISILRGLSFRAVIIDEAGQATEPELLMPFIYNVRKFILIGDHCQLPPTVISSLASSNNYGRSLFERFYQCFRSQCDNVPERVPIITLTTQYRMHPQIVAMPSKLFYKGQLHTNEGTGVNESINLRPYFIFNLPYTKEKTNCGHSKVNKLEATFIRKLQESVLEECSDSCNYFPSPLTISIITFYRGQKAALIEELKNLKNPHVSIKINTIDAFQGQEADIVILSTVRTSNSIGFLRSCQRLNVALTRARSCLYVCMHAKAFEKEKNWKDLIADAKARGIIKPVTKDTSIKSIRRTLSDLQCTRIPPSGDGHRGRTIH